MNSIQIFNNPDFGTIRTLDNDGVILFCATDVAKALGYASPKDAVAAHCKGAVKRRTPTSGGEQEMNFIPESDLYRLVFSSKLPTAEKFTDWVTEVVLPSIRKNGGYTARPLSRAELMAQALIAAHDELEHKDKQIAELTPKGVFADAVSASKNSILVADLAKLLKQNGVDIGATRLFDWLRANGYLIRRNGTDRNMPTQRSMEQGLFEIKETTVCHSDGHTTISKTPKVTGKGQVYFVNQFLKGRSVAELAAQNRTTTAGHLTEA